jgi:hypothetical protein
MEILYIDALAFCFGKKDSLLKLPSIAFKKAYIPMKRSVTNALNFKVRRYTSIYRRNFKVRKANFYCGASLLSKLS